MNRNDYIAGIIDLLVAAGVEHADEFADYVEEMITFSENELKSVYDDLKVEFGSQM